MQFTEKDVTDEYLCGVIKTDIKPIISILVRQPFTILIQFGLQPISPLSSASEERTMAIFIKRAYESSEPRDGYRQLPHLPPKNNKANSVKGFMKNPPIPYASRPTVLSGYKQDFSRR